MMVSQKKWSEQKLPLILIPYGILALKQKNS